MVPQMQKSPEPVKVKGILELKPTDVTISQNYKSHGFEPQPYTLLLLQKDSKLKERNFKKLLY